MTAPHGGPRARGRHVARWAAAVVVVGAVALAAAGLAAATALATPAAADPIASCTTTTGVIVVVDFSPWGGAVTRGCAAAPATGYAALLAAGFTPAGDVQDGSAYICRIDDQPPPSQDPCVNTPPASATWSYWHADAGQSSWTYSMLGAASYRPPPGSVDAWTFGAAGAGSEPSFSPASVRATNPGPTVTTPSPAPAPTTPGGTTAPGGPAGTVGSSGASTPPAAGPGAPATGTGAAHDATPPGSRADTGSGAGGVTGAAAGGGTGSGPTATKPVGPGATTSTGPRSKPRIVAVGPTSASARGQPSGSPLPVLAGAAVLLVLVGTGAAVAWRRRRQAVG